MMCLTVYSPVDVWGSLLIFPTPSVGRSGFFTDRKHFNRWPPFLGRPQRHMATNALYISLDTKYESPWPVYSNGAKSEYY